jgi:hypothetical protein
MRIAIVLAAFAALAGLGAGAAQAKLTPVEQKWATPLISVWNVQNAGLHLVLQQAAAKNALIAGSKPNNLALTRTLAALIACKTPADRIKKAGDPPSPRLAAFRDALNATCIHNANGATDFARAIGAITKGQGTKAKAYLQQGVNEFRKGSTELTKAYRALVAVGGKNVFTA